MNQAQALYEAISKLETKEEILKMLPNKNLPYYKEVMMDIIKKLRYDVYELTRLGDDEKETLDYLRLLNLQIAVCEDYVREEKVKLDDEINFVFATSVFGNIYAFSDIESISPEFYDRILKCLDEMRSRNDTFDVSKSRVFSNNGNINGVIERKGYQVRILYRQLDYNTIYIFRIKVKKSDNDKKDYLDVVNRCKLTDRQFNEFKLNFLDEKFKKDILSLNKKVSLDIINYLVNNKRGEKHFDVRLDCTNDSLNEDDSSHNNDSLGETDSSHKNDSLGETDSSHKNDSLGETDSFHKKDSLDDLLKKIKSEDSLWYRMYILFKEIGLSSKLDRKNKTSLRNIGFFDWVEEQNDLHEKGLLSFDKVKLLEKAGFVFSSLEDKNEGKNDKKWMINYSLACDYYKKHGNLLIPSKYKVSFDGAVYNLGSWIATQRNRYRSGKLSSFRVDKLNEIGMVWRIHKTSLRTPKNFVLFTPGKVSMKADVSSISDSISKVYGTLLKMDDDKLDEFMLMCENDDLRKNR